METDDLLTTDEAADALGVSPRTLSGWRTSGENNLPYLKIGRDVRYRQCDIDELLEQLEDDDTEDREDDSEDDE